MPPPPSALSFLTKCFFIQKQWLEKAGKKNYFYQLLGVQVPKSWPKYTTQMHPSSMYFVYTPWDKFSLAFIKTFNSEKNQDLKCKCDDGENVHPWDCCSLGSCNVFCCNCGDKCRTNQTTISDDVNNFLESIFRRFKREDHLNPEIVNVSIWLRKIYNLSRVSREWRAKNYWLNYWHNLW